MSRPDVQWGGLTFVWDDGAYHAALGTGEVRLAPVLPGPGWSASVEAGVDAVPTVCFGDNEIDALEAAVLAATRRHENAVRRLKAVFTDANYG